jgi:hypothetical protein
MIQYLMELVRRKNSFAKSRCSMKDVLSNEPLIVLDPESQ